MNSPKVGICKWQVDCCKPYNIVLNEKIIEEVPKLSDGSPGDLWLFDVHEIISLVPNVSYNGRGKWNIGDIENIIDLFKKNTEEQRKSLIAQI